jgi:hypothetical protein
MLKPSKNPLLTPHLGTVDVEKLNSPAVLSRGKRNLRRELRDERRTQSAADAIKGLTKDNELFGFTMGRFSMLDLIQAVLQITGPVHLSLSTWTASIAEISALEDLFRRGAFTAARFLLDMSMSRREPACVSQLQERFGKESIRVGAIHSKFALFQNETWKVVLRGSFNLNMNPRLEDYLIAHDPELAGFINTIMDEIWAKQKTTEIDERPYDIIKHFADL